MATVSEICQYACETAGDISSEALDYAKRALRIKYDTLYLAHAWRESLRVIDAVPLDQSLNGVLFLPFDADEIIFLSLSYDGQYYVRLTYRERDWIERFATQIFMLPGALPWFQRGENLAWPHTNPGNIIFSTVNTTPFQVYIEGTDGIDHPYSESFILQATTNPDGSVTIASVTTQIAYKTVTVISKDATDKPLWVASLNPTVTQIPMAPAQTEMVFTQIILTPPPVWSANPVYVRLQVKLKPDSLNNDYSVPRISSIWDALVCFTTGSMYRRLQQVSKAQEQEGEAMQHVTAAINKEKNQAEFRQQVVPMTYESGNYLGGWWPHGDSANPFGGWYGTF